MAEKKVLSPDDEMMENVSELVVSGELDTDVIKDISGISADVSKDIEAAFAEQLEANKKEISSKSPNLSEDDVSIKAFQMAYEKVFLPFAYRTAEFYKEDKDAISGTLKFDIPDKFSSQDRPYLALLAREIRLYRDNVSPENLDKLNENLKQTDKKIDSGRIFSYLVSTFENLNIIRLPKKDALDSLLLLSDRLIDAEKEKNQNNADTFDVDDKTLDSDAFYNKKRSLDLNLRNVSDQIYSFVATLKDVFERDFDIDSLDLPDDKKTKLKISFLKAKSDFLALNIKKNDFASAGVLDFFKYDFDKFSQLQSFVSGDLLSLLNENKVSVEADLLAYKGSRQKLKVRRKFYKTGLKSMDEIYSDVGDENPDNLDDEKLTKNILLRIYSEYFPGDNERVKNEVFLKLLSAPDYSGVDIKENREKRFSSLRDFRSLRAVREFVYMKDGKVKKPFDSFYLEDINNKAKLQKFLEDPRRDIETQFSLFSLLVGVKYGDLDFAKGVLRKRFMVEMGVDETDLKENDKALKKFELKFEDVLKKVRNKVSENSFDRAGEDPKEKSDQLYFLNRKADILKRQYFNGLIKFKEFSKEYSNVVDQVERNSLEDGFDHPMNYLWLQLRATKGIHSFFEGRRLKKIAKVNAKEEIKRKVRLLKRKKESWLKLQALRPINYLKLKAFSALNVVKFIQFDVDSMQRDFKNRLLANAKLGEKIAMTDSNEALKDQIKVEYKNVINDYKSESDAEYKNLKGHEAWNDNKTLDFGDLFDFNSDKKAFEDIIINGK